MSWHDIECDLFQPKIRQCSCGWMDYETSTHQVYVREHKPTFDEVLHSLKLAIHGYEMSSKRKLELDMPQEWKSSIKHWCNQLKDL